jgi:hypothetical protein
MSSMYDVEKEGKMCRPIVEPAAGSNGIPRSGQGAAEAPDM